jgi:armadillo repeat-containing protein 8
VRDVRNACVGSRHKKLQHLHLVPALVHAARGEPELAEQAAAALGSLAAGLDDGARAVLDAGGLDALLAALADGPPRVAVAAARALKQLLAVRLALPRHAALRCAPQAGRSSPTAVDLGLF